MNSDVINNLQNTVTVTIDDEVSDQQEPFETDHDGSPDAGLEPTKKYYNYDGEEITSSYHIRAIELIDELKPLDTRQKQLSDTLNLLNDNGDTDEQAETAKKDLEEELEDIQARISKIRETFWIEVIENYVWNYLDKKFSNLTEDRKQELRDEGAVGFTIAFNKMDYDPYRCSPTTYFQWPIKHNILESVTRGTNTTSHYASMKKQIDEAWEKLESAGREPNERNISELTKIPYITVVNCLLYRQNTALASLNTSGSTNENGDEIPLLDMVPSKALTPEEHVIENEKNETLHIAISKLPEMEQEIVSRINDKDELKVIAKDLNISVDKVNMLKNKAYKSLKEDINLRSHFQGSYTRKGKAVTKAKELELQVRMKAQTENIARSLAEYDDDETTTIVNTTTKGFQICIKM